MGTHHAHAPGGPRPGGLPPWAWAVLISVGAHALLFVALLVVRMPTLQLPVTPPADATPKPTFFRVGVWSPAAPAAEAQPAPSAPAAPRAAGKPSPAAPVAGEALPAAPTDDVAVAPPVAEAADAVEPPGPGGAGEPSAGAPAGSAASSGGDAVSAGGTTPGSPAAMGRANAAPGADVVGLVHARLAAGAERCYPAAARRYQQRGTAEVRFCVDESGRALETSLVKTSGSSLLDAAVGDCVLPAASPFPSSAQGHCFTVPVRFGAR